MTNLLTIADLSHEDLLAILALSESSGLGRPLADKGVALVFEKPSTRTRNSTEMAVVQLGGHPIVVRHDEIGIGSRETPEDVARTLACYHAVIAARVFDHAILEAMAAATSTPILNMLSNRAHPLQAFADLLTVRQLHGSLNNVKIAYVGDANNVARSLAEACSKLGVAMTVASPDGYGFGAEELAALPGITQLSNPYEAVDGAQFVYTDVWVSMGQDAETATRAAAFADYRVTADLMAHADDAYFLHCLPAIRDGEIAAEVIDGPASAVWQQAENRMHSARGALAWMLGIRP